MIVAIHQPNYLPYLGFFDKMKKSDVFVIYDDAQFSKGDFHNRNKIRIFNKWKWLTVPVDGGFKRICDTTIDGNLWREEHRRNIYEAYKNAPRFDDYKDILKIYDFEHDRLLNLNMSIISFMMRAFDIKTKIVYSSELRFESKSTQKLVDVIKLLGGDTYLSGIGGHKYLDISLFEKYGIKVEFQEFDHPIYHQAFKGFIPNMSAIDALFCGYKGDVIIR